MLVPVPSVSAAAYLGDDLYWDIPRLLKTKTLLYASWYQQPHDVSSMDKSIRLLCGGLQVQILHVVPNIGKIMGIPFKFRALAHRWVDGAKIQVRINDKYKWEPADDPSWKESVEFRLAPNTEYTVELIRRITVPVLSYDEVRDLEVIRTALEANGRGEYNHLWEETVIKTEDAEVVGRRELD